MNDPKEPKELTGKVGKADNTDKVDKVDKVDYSAPRYMKASEFKAKCLKLMDEVAEYNGEVIITKNQTPVAKLVPCKTRPKTLFGRYKGRMKITGEIIDVADLWDEMEAEIDPDRVLNP